MEKQTTEIDFIKDAEYMGRASSISFFTESADESGTTFKLVKIKCNGRTLYWKVPDEM